MLNIRFKTRFIKSTNNTPVAAIFEMVFKVDVRGEVVLNDDNGVVLSNPKDAANEIIIKPTPIKIKTGRIGKMPNGL
jgi:hypothetical protein